MCETTFSIFRSLVVQQCQHEGIRNLFNKGTEPAQRKRKEREY
jgi:hypothetical protein